MDYSQIIIITTIITIIIIIIITRITITNQIILRISPFYPINEYSYFERRSLLSISLGMKVLNRSFYEAGSLEMRK